MATNTETSKVIIDLDIAQSQEKLKALKSEATSLKTELKEIEKTKGINSAEYEQARGKLANINDEVKQLRKQLNSSVDLIIEGKSSDNTLRELNAAARKLRSEIQGTTQSSEELVTKMKRLAEIEVQIEQLNQPLVDFKKGLRDAGQEGSLVQLRARAAALRAELDKLPAASQEFKDKSKEFQTVAANLKKVESAAAGTGGAFNFIKEQIKQIGPLAAAFFGFQFIAQQFTNIISGAGKLSDQLADLRKTTGFTVQEVEELNRALGKIDTRTSTSELRNIGIVAGQLGIAKQDILGFVESTDKLNVALGDEFGGNAEALATELGKLRNVFADVKSLNVGQDMLRIGNALNVLGAAGAATGPVVADFANRIGSVGIPLGLTTGQVLGLGATLQELNVNTERGGTAVTRILQRMLTNVDEFAKIAGQSTQAFSKQLDIDLFGAFQSVVQGSQQAGGGAVAFANVLKDLGVDGAGASEVFAKLGSNSAILAEKVALSSEAITKADSVNAEFAIKNETLGAKLDKLSKEFNKLLTSEGITNFLKGAVDGSFKFIAAIRAIPDFIAKNSTALISLAGVVALYNAKLITATVASIANTTAEIANKVAYELGYRALLLKEAITKVYAFTVGVLTGQITLAAAAQRIWNAVMALNPIGLIIIGITALVAAIDLYRSNTAQAIQLQKEQIDLGKKLDTAIISNTQSQEIFNQSIQDYKTLSQQAREELLKTIEAKRDETKATLEQAIAQQKAIRELASTPSTLDQIKNGIVSLSNPAAGAFGNIVDGAENGNEAASAFNDKIKQLQDSLAQLEGSASGFKNVVQAEKLGDNIDAKNLDQLNQKLQNYQTALSGANIKSDEYIRIQQKIVDVQKQINGAGSNTPSGDNDAAKKQADQLKSLAELEQKLGAARVVNLAAGIEKELALLDQKYTQELAQYAAEAGDTKRQAELKNAIRLQLEQTYQTDKQALVAKAMQDQAQAEFDQDIANLEAGKQQQELALAQQHAEGLLSDSAYAAKLAVNQLQYLQTKLKNYRDYGRNTVEIEKQIADQIINVNAKLAEQIKSLNDNKLNREKELLDAQLANATLSGDARLEIEIQKTAQERDLRISNFTTLAAEELSNLDTLLSEKLISEEEYAARVAEIKQSEVDFKKAQDENYAATTRELSINNLDKSISQFQQYYAALSNIANQYFAIQKQKEDRELSSFKRTTDTKKKLLEQQLNQGVINRSEYDGKLAALDVEYDRKAAAIKKKQFERQQVADIISATINTAVAITGALKVDPTGVLAIIVGIAGALQIAAIASQKPPEFVDGGRIPGTAPDKRKDNLLVIDKATGRAVASIQSGEIIIPQETADNNPQLVAALLNANGSTVDTFSTGSTPDGDGKAAVNKNTTVRVVGNIDTTEDVPGKQAVNFLDPVARQGKAAVNFLDPATERIGKAAVNFDDILSANTSRIKGDLPQFDFQNIIKTNTERNAGVTTTTATPNFNQQSAQTQSISPAQIIDILKQNNAQLLSELPSIMADELAKIDFNTVLDYDYFEKSIKRNSNSKIGGLIRK